MHTPIPEFQAYESLADLLEQEEAIYAEMLGLLTQEGEAMRGLAGDALAGLAQRKETLALRVKALDESRRLLARRLATRLSLPEDQITITLLCEHAPLPAARRLAEAGGRLRRTVLQCKELNDSNAHAATRGLDLLNGAIQYLIDGSDPAGKVYQAPPRKARGYVTFSKTGGSGFVQREA